MLIWETTSTSAKALRALAARTKGAVQCLVREDKAGSFIFCEHGDPPRDVLEKQVTELFSGGRYGPETGTWVFRVGLWTPKDWRSEFCSSPCGSGIEGASGGAESGTVIGGVTVSGIETGRVVA